MQISIFHTVFNLTNTIILFPFANQLVKISGLVIKEKPGEKDTELTEEEVVLKHLDERIFESPAFALETAVLEVIHMGQITQTNLGRAVKALKAGARRTSTRCIKQKKPSIIWRRCLRNI